MDGIISLTQVVVIEIITGDASPIISNWVASAVSMLDIVSKYANEGLTAFVQWDIPLLGTTIICESIDIHIS